MGRNDNPYAKFENAKLILRDELALDRTVLANERTFLAYVRTALALLLAGVTFVYLATADWFAVVGIVCLAIGAVSLLIGVHRFVRMRRMLGTVRAKARTTAAAPGSPPGPNADAQ